MQAESAMGSQRFCLRWNNHQTNLLSVFDQLLHEESFVDVTLAVEGQFLRAHKMVLSACSPYFQALFISHPDKHPIVILKDVPYSDMKSLLDFMYRGEVSVDQDRLTAFLKVAESLRIKGLTEVNEERCDIPSIANSLLSQSFSSPAGPPPPPNLQRIPPPASSSPSQSQPQPAGSPSSKSQPPLGKGHQSLAQAQSPVSNPMLNSALTAPKRKRGRPRKLSGSSPNPPPIQDEQEDQKQTSNATENHLGGQFAVSGSEPVSQPLPATTVPHPSDSQLRPGVGVYPSGPPPPGPAPSLPSADEAQPQSPIVTKMEEDGEEEEDEEEDCEDIAKMEDDEEGDEDDSSHDINRVRIKTEDPQPGTSAQDSLTTFQNSTQPDSDRFSSSGLKEMDLRMLRLVPRSDLNFMERVDCESDGDDILVVDAENNNEGGGGPGGLTVEDMDKVVDFAEPGARVPIRKRIRRRAASSADPAEALTEMSVRGLNLFRYASINEGVYKCMECAKTDVCKTFKNKYSFQRHAFLYHEGHQRKVFPCPVCAKEFSRPDKMKNHMKMVHDCFIPKECMFPAVGFYLPP